MKEIILKHLEEHGSITSLEAIEKYKCTRLSQLSSCYAKLGTQSTMKQCHLPIA